MKRMNVTAVGICGGSGSGKTTIARGLCEQIGADVSLLLSQDRYYRDLAHLTPVKRNEVNFDHPDAVDFDSLARDIERLKSGMGVVAPVYDLSTHTRAREGRRLDAKRIIVVEGLLILNCDEVRRLLDFSIFLKAPDDIRLIRRIRRDRAERGRTEQSVISQYLETVRPMHEKFVRPSAAFADLAIDTTGEVDLADLVRRVPALNKEKK